MSNIKHPFIILIGSYARGTQTNSSDLDIVRIDSADLLDSTLLPHNKINVSYIDYDFETFSNLMRDGSLFIYHIFTEGKLLHGSIEEWSSLAGLFQVKENFSREISEYVDLLKFLNSAVEFENSFMPYLSNTFKACKNIAIFSLASSGKYIFDKKMALCEGLMLDEHESSCLILANNAFERDFSIAKEDIIYLQKFSHRWSKNLKNKLRNLFND